jgi:hypothetical protein
MGHRRTLDKTASSPAPSLLEAALEYANRGWTVLPARGKQPAVNWKLLQKQRPDAITLRRLLNRPGISGVCVLTGTASGGLACRDFDVEASYYAWERQHPEDAARLPTVRTPRGFHVYARIREEHFENLGDGEFRGDSGHITLLPPSLHPTGMVYHLLVPLPDGQLPLIDPVEVGLCDRADGDCGVDGANRAAITHPPQRLQFSRLSLSSLLQAAESAIDATLPRVPHERNRCLFNLARHLKGIPSLAGAAVGQLRPIVQEWHRRALPVIRTKPFVETWTEFIQAWRKVRVPAGLAVIETAFQRATDLPPTRQAVELYGEGPILLLASVCRELQKIVGTGHFFLDCRTAGRLIGVDHVTAWRYLEVLCADGVLAPGAKGNPKTRRASRFRYIGGVE